MDETGLVLALSVAMHVTWNLIARQQHPEAYPLWWVLLAHLVLLGPWGFWALLHEVQWSPAFVGLLLSSALANVLYFIALAKAYEQAAVAFVYPLVRSSPLLIALWGSLLLGQIVDINGWLGIGISVAGLGLIASTARTTGDRRALPWALLAMLSTSIYSLSDQVATRHIDSFMGLVGFLSVGYLCAWLSLTLLLKRRTGSALPPRRIHAAAWLVGGLCIGLAYALVIHAMRTLPSAEVVTYTNAGIVLATLLSIFWFREREHWQRRMGGAVVVMLGLAVLAS